MSKNFVEIKTNVLSQIRHCFTSLDISKCSENLDEPFKRYSNTTVKQISWNKARPYESIPGPKPVPILGNLWHYIPVIGTYAGLSQYEINIRQNEEFGNLVRLSDLKLKDDIVLVFDPNDIETVYRNEGQYPARNALNSIKYYRLTMRNHLFQDYGGLFVLDGEKWQEARTRMNPVLMQIKTMKQYAKPMEQIADDFVKKMQYLTLNNENGQMPDYFENELHKWALESVGIVAFDNRMGMLDLNLDPKSEKQQFIDDVLTSFAFLYKIDMIPSLSTYISTPTWRKYVKTLDGVTNFVLKQLNAAIDSMEKNGTYNKNEEEMSIMERMIKLDRKYALGTAMDMLIGGIETTSRTMAAILYYLAKNQEVQDKLRDEVKRVLPNLNSTIPDTGLEDIPYLRAVMKETLRIAYIAIGTARKTNKDMVLSGYQVPEGTQVVLTQMALYWMEEHFKDAHKFIPERWFRNEANETTYNPWVYLPFGFGTRMCVGKRLAQLELEILLAKVIRNFQLYWPHEDMKFKMEMIYGIANPLRLQIKIITT